MNFNTGTSKHIACHRVTGLAVPGGGSAIALARSLPHTSQHLPTLQVLQRPARNARTLATLSAQHQHLSRQEFLCSNGVNRQLKQGSWSAKMQHLPTPVEKQAAGAQGECGGWGRAHLISQLPREESPPDPPLSFITSGANWGTGLWLEDNSETEKLQKRKGWELTRWTCWSRWLGNGDKSYEAPHETRGT